MTRETHFLPPGWEAARVDEVNSHAGALRRVSHAEMARWARDASLFHVIALGGRPGADLFYRYLEVTYFPPGSPRNRLLIIHHVGWEGFDWAMGTVPVRERRFADRVAAKLGMRFADGVPTLIGDSPEVAALGAFRGAGRVPVVARFPVQSPNAFTLEFDAPERERRERAAEVEKKIEGFDRRYERN